MMSGAALQLPAAAAARAVAAWPPPRAGGSDDPLLAEVYVTAVADGAAAARGAGAGGRASAASEEGEGEEAMGAGPSHDEEHEELEEPRPALSRAAALRAARLGRPLTAAQRQALTYDSFRVAPKVEMLLDSRNLRFRELYHAPDTWVNMIAVLVMLAIVVLGATETGPFRRAPPR